MNGDTGDEQHVAGGNHEDGKAMHRRAVQQVRQQRAARVVAVAPVAAIHATRHFDECVGGDITQVVARN
jgi:predicted phosphoribosyltransferase